MQLFRAPTYKIRLDENQIRESMTDSAGSEVSSNVQILRTGTFHHDTLGKLVVTSEMLESMVKNFKDDVRGVDIAIDYKHDSEDIAAGWVRDLRLSENKDELWAQVMWTPKAVKKLSEKEFRYLSADFSLNYKNNETLQEYGPTLFGAGLTNRPVVKNMKSVVQLKEGDNKMDKLQELEKKVNDLTKANGDLNEKLTLSETEKKNIEVKLNEYEGKELEEKDDLPKDMDAAVAMIKELKQMLDALKSEKQNMLKEKELMEKEKKFNELLSENKVVPAQKEAFLKGDMVKFSELSQTSDLNLSEGGNTSSTKKETKSDIDQIIDLAEKKQTDDKSLTYSQAISAVLSENKDLAKAYEAATN